MISFTETNQVTLSMWLQAHAQDPHRFRCDNRWHNYFLVDDDFNPDMGICFGYDPANNAFFISDNTPANIRTDILRIEYRRINLTPNQSHYQALRSSLEAMPASSTRSLLIETLTEFYSNLCLHFEHGEETTKSLVVALALRYLRSLL